MRTSVSIALIDMILVCRSLLLFIPCLKLGGLNEMQL